MHGFRHAVVVTVAISSHIGITGMFDCGRRSSSRNCEYASYQRPVTPALTMATANWAWKLISESKQEIANAANAIQMMQMND